MTHRGPDGDGLYIDGALGLAHRRLSIIDLDGGAQPMSTEDGQLWISYNGEVFNYVELFEELRAWRAGRAKELNQPAFCVFTDATLEAIAEQRPDDVAALVRIPGIGQAKLDRFGSDVLQLVGGK